MCPPPPTSLTPRPPHRGPEALSRGRWGRLGSPLDQKPGSWRCSGVQTQTCSSRWRRKHGSASRPICHLTLPPTLGCLCGWRQVGRVPSAKGTAQRPASVPGHPSRGELGGGHGPQSSQRAAWLWGGGRGGVDAAGGTPGRRGEPGPFGLILSVERSGEHPGLGTGVTPASRSPSQGRQPTPLQARKGLRPEGLKARAQTCTPAPHTHPYTPMHAHTHRHTRPHMHTRAHTCTHAHTPQALALSRG